MAASRQDSSLFWSDTGLSEDISDLSEAIGEGSWARGTMARAGNDAVTLVDVPAPTQGDSFVAFPTDETFAVLAEYGYTPGACAPAD